MKNPRQLQLKLTSILRNFNPDEFNPLSEVNGDEFLNEFIMALGELLAMSGHNLLVMEKVSKNKFVKN